MNQKLSKVVKWGVGIAVLITVGLFAFAAYDTRRLTPIELIYCSDDPIPISRWTCEQFIKYRDLTPAEVAQLNNEAGALFVTGIKDKERADAIMKRWLAQGVQINAHHQKTISKNTALHTAASMGDLEEVEFLLRHGADPDIKNSLGLTPLEWAQRSEARFPEERRQKVIKLLQKAKAGA